MRVSLNRSGLDNDDLRTPFRKVAVFERGRQVSLTKPAPKWLQPLLKQKLTR